MIQARLGFAAGMEEDHHRRLMSRGQISWGWRVMSFLCVVVYDADTLRHVV